MAIEFDRKRVKINAQLADIKDLMDRITIWRSGMEPEAIRIIEAELARRGIPQLEIDHHDAKRRSTCLFGPDGLALRCCRCSRPAVARSWTWHRIAGILPVFPRYCCWCADHQPRRPDATGDQP